MNASSLTTHFLKVIAGFYNITAGLCDIIATAAMCTFLATVQTPYRQLVEKPSLSFSRIVTFLTFTFHLRTKSVVNFLLFFTINRGAFVALTQMAYFATFMAAPSKTYWYVCLRGSQTPLLHM